MKKSVYLSGLLVVCLSLFSNLAKAQVPVVSADPVTDTVCTTDTAYFRVATSAGATPMTFMWEFSTDAGTSWDTVFNGTSYFWATNDTLGVIANPTLHGVMYRSIVFNSAGSDTSLAAALHVDMPSAGIISGPSSVCDGGNVTLTSSMPGGVWSNVSFVIDTISALGVVTGRSFGVDTIHYVLTNTCGTFLSSTLMRVDTVVTAAPVTGPTHVCVGNMITMANANVIGTGLWSVGVSGHSTISTSGVVTGLASGLDTVTYNFSNACVSSLVSSMVITVETLPAAGTITGASALCAGTWTHLTSSVSGGVWISGTTSVAVVSSAGNVTGIMHGSSLISYYQANSCGASFATHAVTVDIPASTITGNDSVGIDSTLALFNASPGGTWTSADTAIAKFVSSNVIKGRDTGVTTVTYAVTNTCGSSMSTITMNVGPLPEGGTVTGPDSVCTGSSVLLTASIPGGVWTNKHDTLASVNDTGLVTGIEFGRDSVYYTVTTAFGSTKVLKRIFVNQPPVITVSGPAAIALGGSYTVYGTPSGGTWTTNNMAMTALIGHGFFVVMDTGTSTFTYTARNTCGTSTKPFTVHLAGSTAGVNGLVAAVSKLNVFPNPTRGPLTVNITATATEQVKVAVTNVAGVVVKEFNVTTNTPTDVVIDQPAGIYLLTAITADGNRHTTRISVAN